MELGYIIYLVVNDDHLVRWVIRISLDLRKLYSRLVGKYLVHGGIASPTVPHCCYSSQPLPQVDILVSILYIYKSQKRKRRKEWRRD